jgi:hypothetical protein
MNSTLSRAVSTDTTQSVVAVYKTHSDAEAAVRQLAAGGVPVSTISIIGRNYETREDVQGFYRPTDAALVGAGQGAWFGGIFGLLLGAFGLFVFPAVGMLIVMGPLSGFLAGAVGGAGVGALVSALVASGIPRDKALKYQAHLEAGEFIVVVHGSPGDSERAHAILGDSGHIDLQTH